MFIVSNKYITNSFDSWFDERVEKALESGINLGRDDLDTSLKNLFELANEISYELTLESKEKTPKLLSEYREKKTLMKSAYFHKMVSLKYLFQKIQII